MAISIQIWFNVFLICFPFLTAFRTNMDKSRKIYSDQGQFKYPEIDCSRPLTIQRSKIGMVYFYIGQMQEGTNMRDGVGIAVHDSGDTILFNL